MREGGGAPGGSLPAFDLVPHGGGHAWGFSVLPRTAPRGHGPGFRPGDGLADQDQL